MALLELPGSSVCVPRAEAVFEDPATRALFARIEQVAPTEATVLVTGETGTGKEVVARHVHGKSLRAGASFVAVNCAALPPTLIESELFGHERGAFTGAVAAKAGWFEVAAGGTLFLDEIGDLPLSAQCKLLRVLQEREVVRIGARQPIRVDVRVIAATNANLDVAVDRGSFRSDLYYRLHVAHLAILPLRERAGDVLPLARHFLTVHAASLGVKRPELSERAIERLVAHDWPGNIRELENAIHHGLLTARDGRLEAEDLPLLRARLSSPPARADATRGLSSLRDALRTLFEEERPDLHREVEELLFRTAFEFSENNQVRTARLLGISRNILRARLIQYGLLAPASRRGTDGTDPLGAEPAPPRGGSAPGADGGVLPVQAE